MQSACGQGSSTCACSDSMPSEVCRVKAKKDEPGTIEHEVAERVSDLTGPTLFSCLVAFFKPGALTSLTACELLFVVGSKCSCCACRALMVLS